MSFLSGRSKQTEYMLAEKQSFLDTAEPQPQEYTQNEDGNRQEGHRESAGCCHHCSQGHRRTSNTRLWAAAWLLQCIIFLAAIAMLANSLKKAQEADIAAIGTLGSALRYTVRNPGDDYWSNELYGKPGEESDRAWNKIMKNQTYRITEEDVTALNIGHLPLNPVREGGYAGVLGVFHNLHCLRHFRQVIFKDDYPIENEPKEEDFREHMIHCIEAMRTSMMCHPDLTQRPLIYLKDQYFPFSVLPGVPQKCAEWDPVMKAMESRHFSYKQKLWEESLEG